MLRLSEQFETRYFVYTQIERKGSIALWKRESKLSQYVHWEIVIITYFPGRQNSRNLPPIKEHYPYYAESVYYSEDVARLSFLERVLNV